MWAVFWSTGGQKTGVGIENLGLAEHVDGIFDSARLEAQKPDMNSSPVFRQPLGCMARKRCS